MRSRNIKPGLFRNDVLADCSFPARLLFIGLWCHADREGRFEWREKRIWAEILPYDRVNIGKLLEELLVAGFIRKYQVGGVAYGWVVHFRDHQNPHPHEAQSKLPPPSDREEEKVEGNQCHGMSVKCNDKSVTSRADILIPDTMIPDIRNTDILDTSIEFRLAKYLFKKIRENDPKARRPDLKKWANDIRLMIKNDKRVPDEIEAMIGWCQEDEFWRCNILSPKKLRKKYTTLLLQMKREKKRWGGLKGVPDNWADRG